MTTSQTGRGTVRLGIASVPLHPLFAAACPILLAFASSAGDVVGIEPVVPPLMLALGITLMALSLLALVLRDWQRAGLITTVLVIGFFSYGHAWNAIGLSIIGELAFGMAWAVLVIIAAGVAWWAGRWGRVPTVVLNLAGALVVAASVWTAGASVAELSAVKAAGGEPSGLHLAKPNPESLPDVYYIVLDRYAGKTALRQTYDFDNEPFLTALESRGFSVARHAHANYIKTALSLTSSLNMEFLDADALKDEATDGKDVGPIHRRLGGPLAVPRALKEMGYQYLQVANWWTPTQRNVDADRVFRYRGQRDFPTALASTTVLRAVADPTPLPDDPWDWRVMRENNLYALDILEDIPRLPGPKYVFAHLVTTHPPYVHDSDGSFTGRDVVEANGVEDSYRRQLTFANRRMLRLVDLILADDPDAVILLQSDEGPFPERYREGEWGFPWLRATPAELEEKFGILYAMRVPGANLEEEGFHDAITPVNAFRIIFNARFGMNLPLLPDRSWAHIDKYHYYDFFEITDRLVR